MNPLTNQNRQELKILAEAVREAQDQITNGLPPRLGQALFMRGLTQSNIDSLREAWTDLVGDVMMPCSQERSGLPARKDTLQSAMMRPLLAAMVLEAAISRLRTLSERSRRAKSPRPNGNTQTMRVDLIDWSLDSKESETPT